MYKNTDVSKNNINTGSSLSIIKERIDQLFEDRRLRGSIFSNTGNGRKYGYLPGRNQEIDRLYIIKKVFQKYNGTDHRCSDDNQRGGGCVFLEQRCEKDLRLH